MKFRLLPCKGRFYPAKMQATSCSAVLRAMCDYDLQPTIALFERYLTLARQKRPTEIHALLGAEALERLDQLRFLLSRVTAIQHHVLNGRPLSTTDFFLPIEACPASSDTGQAIRDAFFHVQLYTESFYYLAFRFRQILTTQSRITGGHPLPLLHSFECFGVRDVRNHLLEHPEGRTSQKFSQDHSLGGSDGPQLKLDSTPSAHTDRGLFVNAAEFNRQLHATLSHAIATLESE
ncbi:MAG: hypothetical protein JO295_09270 [Verrucomicrobia bacterium]|nr:hypothetical protein [Verrucomicrobiota bacterium]